ncbi:hypothetical protein BT69DRAFT_1334291 [Atractiella rhizophila]|nr:hypothetical protein BT69DRAFT_1334291 [Atractiella rhizophila]
MDSGNVPRIPEKHHGSLMFRMGDSKDIGKRKREKERMDPVKSRRPEPPVVGPGKGGSVGASATQHIVRGLVRDSMRDEDPREALLKYARKEGDKEDDASNWTKAWEKTQPKPVWDETPYEEEAPKKK